MKAPKVYCRDFNNILIGVKKKLDLVEDPRDADCLLLWQDVRGDMLELCRINNEYMKKPVVVVQHGRAATNDYLPPNKFPMTATRFCCWGVKDYERLNRAGYADRAVITGSPLVDFLQPRIEHDGKNIVFCPVITQHEEPENIMAYWTLKRIEMGKALGKVARFRDSLKEEWNAWVVEKSSATEGSIPYYNWNKEWRLIAKITDIHDKRLYFGDVVLSSPANKTHLNDIVRLLEMTDCVVGIEEGTFQLLAMAMGIPVVMVDGFKYKEYGGVDYSTVEMVKTDAVTRVNPEMLEEAIDGVLSDPDCLKEQRDRVVKDELWDGKTNPVDNILNVISEVCNA